MNLLTLVPLPYRLLALALLSAALFCFGWLKGAEHGERKLEQFKLSEQVQVNKGMKAAADKTHAWQQQKDEALRDATKRAQDNAAAAVAARAESSSLRSDLIAARGRMSNAPDSAVRDYAAALGELLGQCSEALTELARKADGHAADALMFERAWPKP